MFYQQKNKNKTEWDKQNNKKCLVCDNENNYYPIESTHLWKYYDCQLKEEEEEIKEEEEEIHKEEEEIIIEEEELKEEEITKEEEEINKEEQSTIL